ncbi:hypothetical protein [Rhizobium sp. GCM10022189]
MKKLIALLALILTTFLVAMSDEAGRDLWRYGTHYLMSTNTTTTESHEL